MLEFIENNNFEDKDLFFLIQATSPLTQYYHLDAALKQLKNENGAYPQQMLSSQISYVLNMISRADQIPGQDAIERLDDLQNQFNKIKEDVKK